MTPNMRETAVSLLHKGKGLSKEEWKNDRPVSVTATEYRIMGRCVQKVMGPVLARIIGDTQPGFVPGRRIDDDLFAATEIAHRCERKNKDAIFICLDMSKAYDRVQIPFLEQVMTAHGFPEEMLSVTRMMHKDCGAHLKIDGKHGESFPVRNGVRQGCVVAPSFFLLAQEVFLRMIRTDKGIGGVEVPDCRGITGENTKTVKELAYADDTGVWLPNDTEALDSLFKVMADFERGYQAQSSTRKKR